MKKEKTQIKSRVATKSEVSIGHKIALSMLMFSAFAVGLNFMGMLASPEISKRVIEPIIDPEIQKPGIYQLAGWPQKTDDVSTSIPLAVNLDDDSDLEIVRGTRHAIYAYNPDGTLVPGWPYYLGTDVDDYDSFVQNPTFSTTIDNDGKVEIVFTTSRWYGTGSSKIYALNHNGTIVPNFPIDLTRDTYRTPVVGDITGDGKDEIIVSVPQDNIMLAYTGEGELLPGWPKDINGWSWAHPVLADMNRDGILDIIYGSNNEIKIFQQETPYNGNGSLPFCWPYKISENLDSNTDVGQIAVADIDQNGSQEIIFAVSSYEGNNESEGNYKTEIYALNEFCQNVEGWPVRINDSVIGLGGYVPVIGDIDGDYDVEIVYVEGPWQSPEGNKIHVLNHDGSVYQNWPLEISTDVMAPALMDLNGDKKLDIVYNLGGYTFARDYKGNMLNFFPLRTTVNPGGTMQLISADINNNNSPELIIAEYGFKINIFTILGSGFDKDYYWPQYQNNSAKTGSIAPKIIPTCVDLDSNDDIYVRGATTGIDSYGKTYISEDICYGVNDEGIGTQVGQFWCQNNPNGAGMVSGQRVSDCENGCSAVRGVCISDILEDQPMIR